MRTLIAAGAVLALAAGPAVAQNKTVKIGFISTFSGPTAVIGQDMRNSFELALDHMGRKMGGLPVEVIYEDDMQKPDVGKQKTEKLIESDKVDFIAGYIWSNVLLASLKPIVDSKTMMVVANAGPSQLAGELCSPYVFSTSWQNDQTPQAVGEYMNQKGVKSVYLIGPNYAAGKDMLSGVASTFKGKIVGQDLTKWPDQLDFSAELSKARAAKPDAVFVFYPGASGVQFLTQYAQAGLKGQIPLYTAFTIDELSLPLQKELALGVPGAQQWVNDLPNEQNKKFVADYRKKYPGLRPTFYGAQSYDAAQLINSAVVAVNGDLSKKDAMRDEMRKANFPSVRGPYKYGNNHIPIQNFYLQDVVKGEDKEFPLSLKTVATIVKDSQDRFHDKCPMKW
ncbi:ABC transporter substrate-binding protein [Pseudorhodoplanes sinuspersici]|uniref:ABC transporter substrate-binding protein n=1 Tax=Pseudorhodoplanes sinuspersici TaxID=1235591 RepID=A0A1W6ZPS4_9HYPH|nr:ABC transporter substrate-binding protein [Pseudorhodoplanes sinuspersici]ARP99312.1 ABC transporter substrate-binding protein [Pseudorhodoplanes sinuspersici]RKE70241.1 branched-chain amino acid transport system substrate-binding protein [Pseudorhodoplanes sinuspersici]